jgi:inner membrane protein
VDPLTHAALGAAWARPLARRPSLRAATAVALISAMTPDLDLLFRSSRDPLLAIELHRHFTHSLAFAPIGALICSAVLFPFFRRSLSFRACYGFSLLGYLTHGLLDACTSYGTLLFWPFSHRRIALDLVSVADPLMTLPLIGFIVLAAWKRRPALAALGIAWCLLYLGFGSLQDHRAAASIRDLAAARGHAPVSVDVKPTLGNLWLFKAIYAYDGRFYIDAVRMGLGARIFEGQSLQILDAGRDFPWLSSGTQQWRDVERFQSFADGYLAQDPEHPNRIVDLRYSLVPNRPDAFWGIELDPGASADTHAAYVTMRIRSPAEGTELLRMLFR